MHSSIVSLVALLLGCRVFVKFSNGAYVSCVNSRCKVFVTTVRHTIIAISLQLRTSTFHSKVVNANHEKSRRSSKMGFSRSRLQSTSNMGTTRDLFCFETSDTNRKVMWYATQVWLVVGVYWRCISQLINQLQPPNGKQLSVVCPCLHGAVCNCHTQNNFVI